jgi:hypothetical protein
MLSVCVVVLGLSSLLGRCLLELNLFRTAWNACHYAVLLSIPSKGFLIVTKKGMCLCVTGTVKVSLSPFLIITDLVQ